MRGSDRGCALAHGLSLAELEAVCLELGAEAYRARQIWRWMYRQCAADWTAMTNLPAGMRNELGARVALDSATAEAICGPPGGTRKILARLRDGERIEEVLIPAGGRRTVCVSSQVGCRFRCAFCASGQAGFRRDLSAGEIVGQVVLAARAFAEKPTHVVVMGIGEPLDNYEAVLKAVRIVNDPDGLAIGARRITISTCGVIPGIRRLAEEELQIELSVSLHAIRDEVRSALMPVNRKHPLAELLDACREYVARTKRIITFEYTLMAGRNDSTRDAEELARRLRGLPCRVNLIPLSPVPEFKAKASAPGTAKLFISILARAGINATFRASRGEDIQAACGQLRLRSLGAGGQDGIAQSPTRGSSGADGTDAGSPGSDAPG